MFCPECGAAHTPGGSFCGNCGTRHPFAAMAAAGPDTRSRALAPPAPAARGGTPVERHASHWLPTPLYTIVGVICAVAVGVVFALLTEVLRGRTDVGAMVRASAHPVDAKPRRGAMETLMANGRQGETK